MIGSNVHSLGHSPGSRQDGFTLVELMVVLVLSAIVTAVIYKFFPAQQKVSMIQDDVVEMQQQLRAAMNIMVREIRMAGYNPKAYPADKDGIDNDGDGDTDEANEKASWGDHDGIDNDDDLTTDEALESACGTGIIAAGANTISFSLDITGPGGSSDGDCLDSNENITYSIDNTNHALQRKSSIIASDQTIAENVEALSFAYAFDDDDPPDGQLDKSGGNVIWAIDTDGDGELDQELGGGALSPNVKLDKIRAVKFWLLICSDRADKDFEDHQTYSLGSQTFTPTTDDQVHRRRRLLSSTIHCRNMGL